MTDLNPFGELGPLGLDVGEPDEEECPSCDREGTVPTSAGQVETCKACDGTGWVRP